MNELLNYYELLNLNRGDSVEEINRQLSKLENDWRRREITMPEKAAKTLVLIIDARKVFQNEQTKAQYDWDLDNQGKEPEQVDYDAERRKQLEQCLNEVGYYYTNGQLAFAKDALDRASQFLGSDENSKYYYWYSNIAYDYNDLQTANNMITRALRIEQNQSAFYIQAASVYLGLYEQGCGNQSSLNEALSYLEMSKSSLRTAISISEQSGNQTQLAIAVGMLADAYMVIHNQDLNEAERLANRLISLGDPQQEANELLQEIRERRQDSQEFQVYQGKNHPSSSGSSGKGCYIATAVYGSYDCPEVWTLRRFRDQVLSNRRSGRAFIKVYYAISPSLVRLFGKQKWFNKFWKRILDKKVARLRLNGIDNSEYHDE